MRHVLRDKAMTTSTSNRHTTNSDDNLLDAARSHRITAAMALYYPSLAGNSLIGSCWDDELLPSGD